MTEQQEEWDRIHDLLLAWMTILDDARITQDIARRIVAREIKDELERIEK